MLRPSLPSVLLLLVVPALLPGCADTTLPRLELPFRLVLAKPEDAPEVPVPPRKPPVPPQDHPRAPQSPAPAAEGSEPPPPAPAPRPEVVIPPRLVSLAPNIVGLDESGVAALLGTPRDVVSEPPGIIWRYSTDGCRLDVFFYPHIATQELKALSFKLLPEVPGDSGQPTCEPVFQDEREKPDPEI